jgi:hypothetical protein
MAKYKIAQTKTEQHFGINYTSTSWRMWNSQIGVTNGHKARTTKDAETSAVCIEPYITSKKIKFLLIHNLTH